MNTTPKRSRYTVTLSINSTSESIRVYAINALDARDRAIAKRYGSRARWWGESSVTGMGQVVEPCKAGGESAVTGRRKLTVTAGW